MTVSAVQARHAAAHAAPGVSVHHGDWLGNGFAAARFDRAYAIKSSEHMPDKQRFFDEAFRTLRPGGLLGVCAWLTRRDPRGWEVRHLLEPICPEGRLPGLGDEVEYRRMAAQAGFATLTVKDLSDRVRRTWSVCARRLPGKLATERRYRRFLLDRTAPNRVFALTLVRLLVAYRTRSMRYGLLLFAKPPA